MIPLAASTRIESARSSGCPSDDRLKLSSNQPSGREQVNLFMSLLWRRESDQVRSVTSLTVIIGKSPNKNKMSRRNIDIAPSKSWYLKENRGSVTLCSLSLIIVGILMVFAGALITYIYFTEITPPNFDSYYQRYVGSSLPRIFGILLLLVGLTLFWSSSIFLVYVFYRGSSRPQQSRFYYEPPQPAATSFETTNARECYIA